MANNKSFKVKNGILAQRYLHSAGVETEVINGYDISNAFYDSVSFSVFSQDINPQGIFFKPDGTKMYVVGLTGDAVYEYDLSTAWDISTASYLQNFSVAAQDTSPNGIFLKPDGTKMYVLGNTNDAVFEYDLSTAWDVSTASYLQNFSVTAQDISPRDIFLKPDGTKMYVVGSTGDAVYEYDLSTAWDISTASYLQNFSVVTQENDPTGVFLKPDGTKMYVLGNTNDAVFEYSLSTPWDISTASYVQNFSTSAQDPTTRGIFFKPDGAKMYIVGAGFNRVYQYTTASYTETLNLFTGTYFAFAQSGVTTVQFTNPPQSGLAASFVLEINGNGSAITWPASIKWHEATTPVATATKEIYTFITTDGGTTYYGRKAAGDLQ